MYVLAKVALFQERWWAMKDAHATGWGPDAPTPAQLKEFFAQVVSGEITKQKLRDFLVGGITVRRPGNSFIREMPVLTHHPTLDLLARAQAFYSKHFGTIPDFSGIIAISPKPEGNYRLAVVAHGMTPNKAYDACAKLFLCWRYRKDLDEVMEQDVRKTDKSYAIWLYADPEAEEKFDNKSFNDLEATRHQRLTLTERLLLEIIYFDETGQHLDRKTVTRCDGSRYPEGYVPGVCWNDFYDGLDVRGYDPEGRRDNLRSRFALS